MNEDPEWRDKMIDYETRMLKKEQEAEEKVCKRASLALLFPA